MKKRNIRKFLNKKENVKKTNMSKILNQKENMKKINKRENPDPKREYKNQKKKIAKRCIKKQKNIEIRLKVLSANKTRPLFHLHSVSLVPL